MTGAYSDSKFECLRCRSGRRKTEVHWTSCAVSRSYLEKTSKGCPFFVVVRARPCSNRSNVSAAAPVGAKTEVHWTSCAVSRSLQRAKNIREGCPFLSLFEHGRAQTVRKSPLSLRSAQNRGPLDLVRRLALLFIIPISVTCL
ncbi:hypothetical protein SAMN02910262_00999 [[Clostridium] aminophilum]|uniref:Uncharacterized protein n=1 Tax=[Clostridium] aminophilum TaxID=1526 RepID=A0A1I6IYS3_9FIRM|nr:hypothetical protein SAMN02910262_00999 [[Clostridium] aminophilum]